MAGHFLFTMVWAGWLCMALALLMLAWKSEQMLYSELLYLELALFMGGGYGVGVLVGIIRVRKLSRSAVAYSDLHRRKVTDIRSVLFPLLIGALIVYTILLTVLYLPYLKSGAELNAGVLACAIVRLGPGADPCRDAASCGAG